MVVSIRIQKVVWLFGAIVAVFTVSTPAQAAKTPVLRSTIHLWHMAVRVPQDFKESGGPSNSLGTITWTITGPSATITLARTLYNPRSAFQILPLQPQDGGVIPRGTSPYVSRYDSGSEVTINIVTRKGTEDSLTVDMQTGSASSSPLAHAIIANWQHPPLLTTTQAVTKLERVHNWYHGISLGLSRGTPNSQWFLVGGPPATAQQSWYLFHTINGGDTWQLQRYTVWQGCQKWKSSISLVLAYRATKWCAL